MGAIAWTPVSQTKSGTGTQADPWVLTTVVRGGGFEITQTDTYSTGNEFYATTSSVKNISDAAQDFTLYHAADCYLQDDDYGFGEYDANTGTVICRAKDPETGEHTDRGRVEQFVPTTAGSNYYYSSFDEVWGKVKDRAPLPNMLERRRFQPGQRHGSELDSYASSRIRRPTTLSSPPSRRRARSRCPPRHAPSPSRAPTPPRRAPSE